MNVNTDRRSGKSLQEWAIIITLAANFAGLIWFAADIKNTQTQTTIQLQNITNILNNVVTQQNNQAVLNGIIKMKLNLPN